MPSPFVKRELSGGSYRGCTDSWRAYKVLPLSFHGLLSPGLSQESISSHTVGPLESKVESTQVLHIQVNSFSFRFSFFPEFSSHSEVPSSFSRAQHCCTGSRSHLFTFLFHS